MCTNYVNTKIQKFSHIMFYTDLREETAIISLCKIN